MHNCIRGFSEFFQSQMSSQCFCLHSFKESKRKCSALSDCVCLTEKPMLCMGRPVNTKLFGLGLFYQYLKHTQAQNYTLSWGTLTSLQLTVSAASPTPSLKEGRNKLNFIQLPVKSLWSVWASSKGHKGKTIINSNFFYFLFCSSSHLFYWLCCQHPWI